MSVFILCWRETPNADCHANVEGNSWKKAPLPHLPPLLPSPTCCCCGASLNTEGEAKRTGAAVGGEAMSGTKGWGTPDLSFHLLFLSAWHLRITRHHCERRGRGESEWKFIKQTSERSAFRKPGSHLWVNVNVCVIKREREIKIESRSRQKRNMRG